MTYDTDTPGSMHLLQMVQNPGQVNAGMHRQAGFLPEGARDSVTGVSVRVVPKVGSRWLELEIVTESPSEVAATMQQAEQVVADMSKDASMGEEVLTQRAAPVESIRKNDFITCPNRMASTRCEYLSLADAYSVTCPASPSPPLQHCLPRPDKC